MFVSKSRFELSERRAEYAEARHRYILKEHHALVDKWNSLVRQVNQLGGEEFLKNNKKNPQFTAEDLQRLIQLCHPDKHEGRQIATDMTQKLLRMRESIR